MKKILVKEIVDVVKNNPFYNGDREDNKYLTDNIFDVGRNSTSTWLDDDYNDIFKDNEYIIIDNKDYEEFIHVKKTDVNGLFYLLKVDINGDSEAKIVQFTHDELVDIIGDNEYQVLMSVNN